MKEKRQKEVESMIKRCNHDCDFSCQQSEDQKMRVIVEEHEKLSPNLIFEIIRHDGEMELERPAWPLILSALAAGLMISFSFYFRSIIHVYVGQAPWTGAITGFGYTTGFLIVILGRLQLFTENTITTVIPVFRVPCWENFRKLLRLWGIVFGANIVGTFIAALFMSSPVFTTPEITQCLLTVSHHIMAPDAMDNIMRGIPAGMLIAAIVWIMPMSRSFAFFTILTFTYFISIGNFAHVVVGSCEAAYDVLMGGSDLYDYFFRFLLPTGLGNIIGGTGVFTLLVSAQVRSENGKQLD